MIKSTDLNEEGKANESELNSNKKSIFMKNIAKT